MTRLLLSLLLLVPLTGCSSHQSPEWTAVSYGMDHTYGTRGACRRGAEACLRRHGSGYLVRERWPNRPRGHAWAWLGEHPGTPGVYYLADGTGTWGLAGSIAEVRRRHGYTAPQVLLIPYHPGME